MSNQQLDVRGPRFGAVITTIVLAIAFLTQGTVISTVLLVIQTIAFAIGVASVPLVGMAIGAGNIQRARQAAWTAAALATGVLAILGLVVVIAPGLWTTLFTQEPTVIQSSASYFLWAGPFYGLFGLGLSLYFSSLGAGKAVGPVLAGTLRLVVVAAGGALLAYWDAPAWMIFALVGLGMAAYGISTVLFVKHTNWNVN